MRFAENRLCPKTPQSLHFQSILWGLLLGTNWAWRGILETDRKNHFHFHFFMIFNFAASNLATVSKEQMYGWGTIGCTARTATPTMRVNFFSSQGHQTSNKDNFTLIFQGWSSAKCDCDWRKKIYTRLSFTSTAWVASWPVLDRVKLLLSDCNVSCIRSNTAPPPPPHQIQVNQSFSANTHIPQYNLLRSINYTRCILYSAKHVNCKMLIGMYNQYPV